MNKRASDNLPQYSIAYIVLQQNMMKGAAIFTLLSLIASVWPTSRHFIGNILLTRINRLLTDCFGDVICLITNNFKMGINVCFDVL